MVACRLQLGLLGLLTVACDIVKGQATLGDRLHGSGFLGFHPPTLIAEGEYDHLDFFEWRTRGITAIVARRRQGAETTIAVRALDGSINCDMRGTTFSVQWPQVDTDASGEVAVLDDPDGDGVGTLAFYDGTCTQLGAAIDSATLPIAVPNRDRFLVTAASRLLALEPRTDSVEVLAETLDQIDDRTYQALPDAKLAHAFPTWFIDGGRFAALDDNGFVMFRQGTRVTEVASIGDSSAARFVLNDGGQLTAVTAAEAITYALDICQLRSTEVNTQGPYVEYRSPCMNGPLRAAQLIGDAFESVAIDSVADRVIAFDGDFANPSALFTRPSVSGDAGKELWFRVNGGTPERLAQGVAWTAQGYVIHFADGALGAQLFALVDASGASGRLVTLNPSWDWNSPDAGLADIDRRLLTQAEGVPLTPLMNPYYYQLANFNGTTGDFVDPFPTGQVVARGVPADLGAYDTSSSDHIALLADCTAEKGRLGMLARAGVGGTPVSTVPRTIEWLADDVALRSFQFYSQMPAIGYLDQWDTGSGAGRFVVHDIDANIDYTIDGSVREQRSVTWPWVGVVYATANGARQGIWSAREQH